MSARGWKRVAIVVGGLVALEAGARIVAPGINVEALTNYLRNGGGSWLLNLYNQIGGGGLVRGGVLALGFLPYLTAKFYFRLVRLASRSLDAMSRDAEGRKKLSRWTQVLTLGLAGIQSLGFARFVEGIPGAVANPGIVFVVQTVVVLTAGSIAAMLLGEAVSSALADDDEDNAPAPPLVTAQQLLTEPGLPDVLAQRAKVKTPSRPVD